MRSIQEIEAEQNACRAILHRALLGPQTEVMRRFLESILQIGETCVSDSPYLTHYNLGKQEALNILINEARKYERPSN